MHRNHTSNVIFGEGSNNAWIYREFNRRHSLTILAFFLFKIQTSAGMLVLLRLSRTVMVSYQQSLRNHSVRAKVGSNFQRFCHDRNEML